MNACKINKLPQYLFSTFSDINIHLYNEAAFKWSCHYGHLEVTKWLINLGKLSNNPINIHEGDECSFRLSCKNGARLYHALCA